MTRAVAVALAVVVVGSIGTGCAIASERSAHRVNADRVPFGLTEANPSTTTTAIPIGSTARIYLIRGGRVVPTLRAVKKAARLLDVMDLLASGATRQERRLGLTSALAESAPVTKTSVSRGIATLDLARSFADIPADEQVLAIAQLVFTVTERPGIGRVRFTFDGHSIDVPRGDGALTVDALARDDFAKQAPRPGS
ncbi:MAG: GerMN domain-containing protein [Acidimicrobiales bacterium]